MSIALSPCPAAAAGTAPSSAAQFRLHSDTDDARAAVEQFIRAIFRNTYSAELHEFMPLLLELRCDTDIQAALGLRPASAQAPLFLEQYLDQPVEQVIAGHTACPVARADIVEIGNLAAARRGASPLLFLIMAATLEAAGYRWLAFTATPAVEKGIARLQCRPLPLSDVDPARLGAHAAHWGTYYETHPRVMCIALGEALQACRSHRTTAVALDQHRAAIADLALRVRDWRRSP